MKNSLLILVFIFLVSALTAEAQPTLLLPVNNTNCISKDSISFSWNLFPGAVDYILTVSANSDLSSPVIKRASNNTTTLKISLPEGAKLYYWSITAVMTFTPQTFVNSAQTWTIRTLSVPPAPLLPANNSR